VNEFEKQSLYHSNVHMINYRVKYFKDTPISTNKDFSIFGKITIYHISIFFTLLLISSPSYSQQTHMVLERKIDKIKDFRMKTYQDSDDYVLC